MSKLSFRARALDASKPMPVYLAADLPDLPDYSAINRAVPQMPSGMEKEEECEHHLQRAICTGLIIPTPEVYETPDIEFYERCYPPDYKMPKQLIHMQPLWQEQEAPEYDMDTDDERWLRQQRHPELTEHKFEEMMDKLEKSSGQTVVTLSEAKLLLGRHDDLIIAVYDYWLNKRLKTQHPLILSVKTENRVGQSSNNPYLAFRRRTEKMQTRKNRKNDESSYEKMLKLRRDLARAATLLELVARRERAKRELVRLTALLSERRYHAGDFAGQLLAEVTQAQPIRPQLTAAALASQAASFRREAYTIPHFPPRAPPTPVDQPRQREKRPYKRRKHRHHSSGTAQGLRELAVYTSSEEESPTRTETGPASPPDDGPFAFKRKAGCFYEMPTSTLCGDPINTDSPSKEDLFEHEVDKRYRYTLTSVTHPYSKCIGFARRRVGRGGRVALDRISTPLDDLWPELNFQFPKSSEYRAERDEEVELETRAHRYPKELSRDYHSGGKYPWRHAFRRHLLRNPELWICDKSDKTKCVTDSATKTNSMVKLEALDTNSAVLPQDLNKLNENGDISRSDSRTNLDSVGVNLKHVIRKRTWSCCSDGSYNSDASLEPVEKEFDKFIDEVNKKWLHFRPKTPPPSPPQLNITTDDMIAIELDTPLTVNVRQGQDMEGAQAKTLLQNPLTFSTTEFTIAELHGETLVNAEAENSGSSLDISGDDLLNENFTGLTDAQVESILSENDLKSLADVDLTKDDKKNSISLLRPDDIFEELVKQADVKDPFLSQGQSGAEGHADSGPRIRTRRDRDNFGSTSVRIVQTDDKTPILVEAPTRKTSTITTQAIKATNKTDTPPRKSDSDERTESTPAPVPTSNIIVEEVNEVTNVRTEPLTVTAFGIQKKRQKEEPIEELQLPHAGIQLKAIQAKHTPLKKHIITNAPHRRPNESVTLVATNQETQQPQIVTVAVSESLKVRLQNHLLSTQQANTGAGPTVVGLVQNGPFTVSSSGGVAVAVPAGNVTVPTVGREGVTGAVAGSSSSPRRVSTPVVHLAPAAIHQKQIQLTQQQPVVVAHSHAIQHVAPNKLKVLHAHALTQSQRTQLLAQSRASGITQLPAVVSLATLGDGKSTPTAALQLKTAPGSVTQFFEIKGGQLAKGPHLVNVVRQPQPGKTTMARLDLNDAKKRGAQVVATFDGSALKGNIATATRPHRVSVSLDGRQIVRAAMPAVRAPQVRHQIQLKNRTLQVAAPQLTRAASDASTSITISAPKTTPLPSSVVANLLQKNVAQIQKGGQKIAISGAGGQTLANVQAIAAFTAAQQLKARQARLVAQPRPAPVAEIVEGNTAPAVTSSATAVMSAEAPLETVSETGEPSTNGNVRRRPTDSLPMEVT